MPVSFVTDRGVSSPVRVQLAASNVSFCRLVIGVGGPHSVYVPSLFLVKTYRFAAPALTDAAVSVHAPSAV